MIALDTSALYAIAAGEPEQKTFERVLGASPAVVGAPTLVELRMALQKVIPSYADAFIGDLIEVPDLRVEAFTHEMFTVATHAFKLFGKGQGHPAQLNFGDCLAYAVARTHAVPLLFKGRDFLHTDIEPAWRP